MDASSATVGPPGQARTFTGTLTIEVPDDVTVNLDAEVGAGDLDVFGTSTSGIEVSREGTFEGDDSGEGVLDLMVRVDVGELEVSRG